MKIFIAVGTQLAFDRLLKTVDEWAMEHPDVEIFAQAGPAKYEPKRMTSRHFVAPQTFEQKSSEADVIIAHAGTGTIFTALQLGKPIIVMPRLAKYEEHRNDHQLATVERFKTIPGIHVAFDEVQLRQLLDRITELRGPAEQLRPHATAELLAALSELVNAPAEPKRPVARVRKLLRSVIG